MSLNDFPALATTAIIAFIVGPLLATLLLRAVVDGCNRVAKWRGRMPFATEPSLRIALIYATASIAGAVLASGLTFHSFWFWSLLIWFRVSPPAGVGSLFAGGTLVSIVALWIGRMPAGLAIILGLLWWLLYTVVLTGSAIAGICLGFWLATKIDPR